MGLREIKRQRLSAAVTILRLVASTTSTGLLKSVIRLDTKSESGSRSGGYALHDGFAGEQWLIAVDHHVQVCVNLARHFIESLGGGIMVRCRHDHFSSERLGGLFDFSESVAT